MAAGRNKAERTTTRFFQGSPGPIRDQNAIIICNQAGILSAGKRIATNEELKSGLDITISELETQKRKDDIRANSLIVLRFTKATRDAFIGISAAMTKIVLPKTIAKSAEWVKTGYGALQPIAEGAGKKIAGDKVDVVGIIASSANTGSKALGGGGKAGELTVKALAINIEVINSAMNHDTKKVAKSSRDFVIDFNAAAAGLAADKDFSDAGPRTAGAFKAVEGVLKISGSASLSVQVG